MPYVPAFDALRAIAVCAVVVFHINPSALGGGFLGVDLFFVLSGYLITMLLIAEYEQTGMINLKSFYMRRILRIVPAFLLMAITVLVVCLLVIKDSRVINDRVHEFFIALAYLTNWARAFSWYPSGGLLGHTWSLATEEQFYILWPLICMLMLQLLRKKILFLILLIAIGIVSVLIWRNYLLDNNAGIIRIYNGFDTRFDGLLFGAIGALLYPFFVRCKQSAGLLQIFCLSIIGIFFVMADWQASSLYQYQLTIFYITCICCLWAFQWEALSIGDNMLLHPAIVHIGRLSYGIYLWHMPILIGLIKLQFSGWQLMLVTLIMTYLIALLSYRTVERYFLSKKKQYKVVV